MRGLPKLFCPARRLCYASAMRILVGIFSLALALAVSGAEIRFNFGDLPAGSTPTNFLPVLKGSGQPAAWKIVTDKFTSQLAPLAGSTPNYVTHGVLAQTSQDMTDEHFPMLLYTGQRFRDFKFTTRFKIVSGIAEQMAGVVFRYQNSSNYYVVRASALGKNVRFYKVVNDLRSDPIGPEIPVTTGHWHTLAVKCDGTQITLWYDDKPVMNPLGDNSLNMGLLGFITKSDAVAYFTDAQVEYTPIISGAQSLVNSILEKQTRLLGLRIYLADTNGATRVVASKDPTKLGMAGTEAESKAIQSGAVFFGRDQGDDLVTLPLHDHNGDYIAAVRLRLKSFFGETQENALSRARQIVKAMQQQVVSSDDLQ